MRYYKLAQLYWLNQTIFDILLRKFISLRHSQWNIKPNCARIAQLLWPVCGQPKHCQLFCATRLEKHNWYCMRHFRGRCCYWFKIYRSYRQQYGVVVDMFSTSRVGMQLCWPDEATLFWTFQKYGDFPCYSCSSLKCLSSTRTLHVF